MNVFWMNITAAIARKPRHYRLSSRDNQTMYNLRQSCSTSRPHSWRTNERIFVVETESERACERASETDRQRQTETETKTEKQRQRHRDRDIETETERQRHRDSQRQTKRDGDTERILSKHRDNGN